MVSIDKMIETGNLIESYQDFVAVHLCKGVSQGKMRDYCKYGLLGEVGELGQIYSKALRNGSTLLKKEDLPLDKVLLELGDILFFGVAFFGCYIRDTSITPENDAENPFDWMIAGFTEGDYEEFWINFNDLTQYLGFTLEQVIDANIKKLEEREAQTGNHLKD